MHKQNNINTVIFDCDGVMFDTTNINKIYYNQMLNHFNLPSMTDDQFHYVHAHTVDEALLYLFGKGPVLDSVKEYRLNINYNDFVHHMIMEPHLLDLLSFLKSNYYNIGIATNRTDTMFTVMHTFSLRPFFDIIITAWDVEKPKPNPECLFKIMKKFQVRPEQVLYIGDTIVDEQAANAAGVLFAAYGDLSLNADYHINNLSEIKRIIEIV